MTDKQFNERIRNMAKSSRISYPENYDAFICRVLEELPDEPEETERHGRWRRKKEKSGWASIPAVLLTFFIVVSAGASVGAVVHGYLRRMEKMSEEKKEEYVAAVREAKINGDYYSREFTKEEEQRGKELAAEYEVGKRYPEQELPVLENEKKVSEYRVCFVKRNSTFHLPDEALSDEELLEIIDYYFKREYSMMASGDKKDEEESIETEKMLSKKEAINWAQKYIKEIHGVDVSRWKHQAESYIPYSSDEKKEYYCIHFWKKNTLQKYSVEFNRSNKVCTALAVEYEDDFDYKSIKSVSEKEVKELQMEGLEIVKKLSTTLTMKEIKCKYMETEKGEIPEGKIEFVYASSKQNGYILIYDFNKKLFFSISKVYDIAEYTEDYNNRAKKRGCKVITLELQESNVAEKEAN